MSFSLNLQSATICEKAIVDSQKLNIGFDVNSAKLLDFGIEHRGGLKAGIALANICTAGLATIKLTPSPHPELPFPSVQVHTDAPLQACLASQYAGWPIEQEEFFAMASGPARALRGKEELLKQFSIAESSEQAVLVLETASLPEKKICEMIADECKVDVEKLFIACAPTRSIAGTLQVVARSVETAMHKLYELGFDLHEVISGIGNAPLPPTGKTDLDSVGWTNDAILYGANVVLWVDSDPESIESIGEKMPSSASNDYGTPFAAIFKQYEYDFYKIDPMLFSPARITFVNRRDGKAQTFGELRSDLLVQTFC